MKSESYAVCFTKEEVLRYTELAGVKNPIFRNMEAALEQGYKGIPVPPAMAMIAYHHIKLPWKLSEPVILRKQECRLYRIMYADEIYTGTVKISKHSFRHNKLFILQELEIFDQQNHLCFNGISHLIAGGVIEKNTV